jgi:hypothetical protein
MMARFSIKALEPRSVSKTDCRSPILALSIISWFISALPLPSGATVADEEAKILHDFFGFLEHPARFLQDWWHWSAHKDFLPSGFLPEILLSPTAASAFASQNQAYRQREVWKKLSLLQKSPSPMTRRELKSSEVSRTVSSSLLAAAIRDLETKARDGELREKWVLDFGLQ